tara:strand:+ start:74 stop:913 length:840 start_codon:yes stop_codon:yes gene_type:complete
MNSFLKFLLIVFLILNLSSCKKKVAEIEEMKEMSMDLQMIEAYKQGIIELESGDALTAAKKFNEAELLFPQSEWAPRASLMSAYSYYSKQYYPDAIDEVNRYLKKYPSHSRHSYAYYLLAISYYDQIIDEKKDLGPLLEAKKYFKIVIEKYPESEFAIDSEFKIELILEILASKEMYLAKYYSSKEKWIPAINRYKIVVEKYDSTIYVEEALHRLVEIYYKIGLIEESKKYANLLGYNYQTSEWYKKSYKVFNKKYKTKKITKKKKKSSLLKRFKSLLE